MNSYQVLLLGKPAQKEDGSYVRRLVPDQVTTTLPYHFVEKVMQNPDHLICYQDGKAFEVFVDTSGHLYKEV